ncbi:MAG: hypothetical protein ACR2MB_00480 [Acidimicrobiales bacterium]
MREPIAQFDPGRLIELFHAQSIDYVMVGGYAGLLHGATRPTVDLDIVPDWEEANLERLCATLRSIDARSITGPECEGAAITPEVLVEREIMTWATDLGRLDTMVGIPDSEGLPVVYSDLVPRAEAIPVAGIVVDVASLDDVITSKEFAARSKDTRALPELRQLRDLGASRTAEPTIAETAAQQASASARGGADEG